MANEVYADGREIACKAASGKSICAFPDVCFTPPQTPATPPGVPIPYPNTGLASDTTDGSKNVKISDKEVMLKNKSYFKKSSGDEAGSAPKKGVITSKNTGKVYFNVWSMDVKIEGENVVRHLDLTTHNHASVPGDTPTWPYLDQQVMFSADPCRKDAAKINFSCTGDEEKDCPKPDPDYQESDCVKAKRCMLAPYSPNKCCPGFTPHHMVPKRGLKDNTKYNADKAPCVCAEGYSWHRNDRSEFPKTLKKHPDMHDIQDIFERLMLNLQQGKGSAMNYQQARDASVKAHKIVFKNADCNEDCLKKQIDNYHKGECGVKDDTPLSEGVIRSQEKIEEAGKPEMIEAGKKIFSDISSVSKAASGS